MIRHPHRCGNPSPQGVLLTRVERTIAGEIPRSATMGYARLDNRERLRIPREAVRAMDLAAGDTVVWTLVDDKLVLQKAADPWPGTDWSAIARAVRQERVAHPERFLTLEESMAGHGVTQADLDALEPEP